MASIGSPLKYIISEKIRERNAAINNNLSVVVNFLSMTLFININPNNKLDVKKFVGLGMNFSPQTHRWSLNIA